MAQVLFWCDNRVNRNGLNWCMVYGTKGPRVGPMVRNLMAADITSDLVSCGWLTTAGFTGAAYFQKPISGPNAVVVIAFPPNLTSEIRAAFDASLGDATDGVEKIPEEAAADGVAEIAGVAAYGVEETANVAAASQCNWTNNTVGGAQWAYMNGAPVSGSLPGKQNVTKPLPAGYGLVGFGVSNFNGRLLLNLKATGVAFQLTLD